jgi:hypothetical protein
VSKLDAQRAMKLARYEANEERARTRNAGSPRVNATPAPVAPRAAAPAAPKAAAASTDTCGHKSMNGRACTREPGHSEKSHRYS